MPDDGPIDGVLTPELDAEVQALTHEQAIGVIRFLVDSGWMEAGVARMGMEIQRARVPADPLNGATPEALGAWAVANQLPEGHPGAAGIAARVAAIVREERGNG